MSENQHLSDNESDPEPTSFDELVNLVGKVVEASFALAIICFTIPIFILNCIGCEPRPGDGHRIGGIVVALLGMLFAILAAISIYGAILYNILRVIRWKKGDVGEAIILLVLLLLLVAFSIAIVQVLHVPGDMPGD